MANEGNNPETEVVTLTDEELVVQFCTENKVSKTATDELLKRGFTSLEALKLVEIDDLSSEKIPRGQRRLIMHIVQALSHDGTATDGTDAGTAADTQSIGKDTGTANGSSRSTSGIAGAVPVTIMQEVEPTPQNTAQNVGINANNSDLYTSLLSNMLSQQKSIQDSANSNANASTTPQPSWNDPLVHISTAAGKSVAQYLDICDFVPNTVVEEDVILGGQGDQQIVVKSGPKKPRLEALTLSQWSVANLSILYKLVGDNKLAGTALMDYLSYTTKVYQLVQRFSLVSVMLYDREYRKLQSSMGFRWGTDVQHLHTLFLQARDKPTIQGNPPKKGTPTTQQGGKPNKPKEKPVCRNFNTPKGCSFPSCGYRHVCMVPGCNQQHSAQTHMVKN